MVNSKYCSLFRWEDQPLNTLPRRRCPLEELIRLSPPGKKRLLSITFRFIVLYNLVHILQKCALKCFYIKYCFMQIQLQWTNYSTNHIPNSIINLYFGRKHLKNQFKICLRYTAPTVFIIFVSKIRINSLFMVNICLSIEKLI